MFSLSSTLYPARQILIAFLKHPSLVSSHLTKKPFPASGVVMREADGPQPIRRTGATIMNQIRMKKSLTDGMGLTMRQEPSQAKLPN